MKTRWLFLFSGFVGGCGPLFSRPGDDFKLTVVTPEVRLIQQVAPVEIVFEVDGCDDFSTSMSPPQSAAGGGASRELAEVTGLGGGRYRALVAPELLQAPDDYCTYDADHQQHGYATLEVKCRLDNRVQTAYVSTRYGVAWRASFLGRGPSDGVFRGATPNAFFEVGSGSLSAVGEAGVGREVSAAVQRGYPPLLAATRDGYVYLHGGCPINDCGSFWFVDTPTVKVIGNAAFLQVFDFSGDRSRFVRNVKVPNSAVDLAVDPDGSVVVLSEAGSSAALTRVINETTSWLEFDGESDPTRFSSLGGVRVFLTRVGDAVARFRGGDGGTVPLGEFAIPGAGKVSYLSLSPAADAFVSIRGGQPWITTLTPSTAGLVGTSTLLATELTELSHQTAEETSFSAAWTDSGVALRDRNGVEVFARTAPFARKWKTVLDRSKRSSSVIGALGMSDSLVLLTSSGLQIFDATGKLTGGADPIPASCGLDYSPRHAAVVGPDTVALSGKRAVYQFRGTLP